MNEKVKQKILNIEMQKHLKTKEIEAETLVRKHVEYLDHAKKG